MQRKGTILGATLLVAGTTIGGGMLALPVATGAAGFFPSLLMMLLGWAFMTLTALYLAEANLWMEKGAHVITMASKLLGPWGRASAWLLYLFIGFASLVAYTAGCADLLHLFLQKCCSIDLPIHLAAVIFVLIFGSVLYLGSILLGRINTILMVGLVISYLLIVVGGVPFVRWEHLLRSDFPKIIVAVPLLLTIFSFQTIIPSLTIYLHQDGRALRRSIILGTSLALLVYLIWQWLVLGAVLYDGDLGLAAALAQGKPATHFLGAAVGSSHLALFADFFAFFALVTSFLGMGLGLFDFLADGLKIPKNPRGKLLLGLLIALPILLIIFTFEKVFLKALDCSGGIGDAILNGLFPAMMVWIGRYRMKMLSEYRVPGGKPLLLVVVAYALFVFTIEILGKLGLMSSLAN